jgi:hypothetical protein
MRSLFRSTFQPARRIAGSFRPALVPASALGAAVFSDERNAILQRVVTGSERMVAIRKWIASRIDADPMLLRTFGQQYIADNFWGYDELVIKDQYYVDLALETLRADLEMWDLSEETAARIDEWYAVIDIMYAAMNEYGKTPLTTAAGTPIPNTTAPPGGTTQSTGGGGRVQPGTNVTNTPPSAGISTKTALLYGGIGLGAVVLALLIKNA